MADTVARIEIPSLSGFMANTCVGGYVSNRTKLQVPRYLVTLEHPSPHDGVVGIAVDVELNLIARWFLVEADDPIAAVSEPSIRLNDHCLVIPAARFLGNGESAGVELRTSLLAPVLDFLADGLSTPGSSARVI